jgi:hypothetical protein
MEKAGRYRGFDPDGVAESEVDYFRIAGAERSKRPINFSVSGKLARSPFLWFSFGFEHVRLTAIGLGQRGEILRHLNVREGPRQALSLFGLFPEEFCLLDHRAPKIRPRGR